MTMKTYAVTLGSPGGPSREVLVPAPTDVQAGDAARPLAKDTESILEIRQVQDAEQLDAEPPKSQAAELAPVTAGAASAPGPEERSGGTSGPDPVTDRGDRHG